jgi:formylglycine-generating enzyme required for sulfatase activity
MFNREAMVLCLAGLSVSSGCTRPKCPAGIAGIPGGHYTMGSGEAATVAKFCLDVTEVTVNSYKKCVEAGRCTEPQVYTLGCNWKHPEGRLNHPVTCVNWNQAASYCSWAGGRLPTEEEWEWAARNGDRGDMYPWGGATPSEKLLNACGSECYKKANSPSPMYAADDGYSETAPVGSFPQGNNRWGVSDLGGNAEEWTSSVFSSNSTSSRTDGPYVNRGGSWASTDASHVSASYRRSNSPRNLFSFMGFRCALMP